MRLGKFRKNFSLLFFCVLVLGPQAVIADDLCLEPNKQVLALIGALNKSVFSASKPGRFAVKRLSAEYEAGRYEVSYLIDNKPIFLQRMDQRSGVSDIFGASASASTLNLDYHFGQGALFCKYQISRTPQTFVARLRGNGAQGFKQLPY